MESLKKCLANFNGSIRDILKNEPYGDDDYVEKYIADMIENMKKSIFSSAPDGSSQGDVTSVPDVSSGTDVKPVLDLNHKWKYWTGSTKYNSILSLAANNLTVLKFFVSIGIDVNLVLDDESGDTLLLQMSKNYNLSKEELEIFEYLLTVCDLNYQNAYGRTVLWNLSPQHIREVLPKIDINLIDEQGQTAIYRLITMYQVDIVKLLTTVGSNLNMVDKKGISPLKLSLQQLCDESYGVCLIGNESDDKSQKDAKSQKAVYMKNRFEKRLEIAKVIAAHTTDLALTTATLTPMESYLLSTFTF